MVHNGDKKILLRVGNQVIYKAYIGDYPVYKTPTFLEDANNMVFNTESIDESLPYTYCNGSKWVRNTAVINRPSESSVPINTHCWDAIIRINSSNTFSLENNGFYETEGTGIYLEPVITRYTWSKDNNMRYVTDHWEGDNIFNVISEIKHCPIYGEGTYKCDFEWYYKNDPQQTIQTASHNWKIIDVRSTSTR